MSAIMGEMDADVVHVTVVWVGDGVTSEVRSWVEGRDDVTLTSTSARLLPATIVMSIGQGAVVTVASPGEEEQALALGSDEVLPASGASVANLQRAIDRARQRARGRELRDLYLVDLVRRDDVSALELFAGAIGHRLSNPLMAAAVNCKYIEDAVPNAEGMSSDDVRTAAGDLSESLAEISAIVKRMRALIESVATDEVVDIVEVVDEVTAILRSGVEGHARFVVDSQPGRCLVGLPRWQLVESIGALVSNATTAASKTDDEGVVEVRLAISGEQGVVVLEVSDNGAGMPPDVRAHAVDPFFTTRQVAGAAGLSLALVAGRIRRAGGELLIDSEPGVGTTVRIFLPLVPSVEEDEPQGLLN